MSSTGDIREGMEVYGSDNQPVGTVMRLSGDTFTQVIHIDGVDHGHYAVPTNAVDHVEQGRVYLPNPASMYLSQLHAYDEEYEQARIGFQEHFDRSQVAASGTGTTRTFEEAEPNYRFGYRAGSDERYAGREFNEVEDELRSNYEAEVSGGTGWEGLREEVITGWNRARGRDVR
jgi:hypothetical protein